MPAAIGIAVVKKQLYFYNRCRDCLPIGRAWNHRQGYKIKSVNLRMKVILLSIILLAIAIAGIAIKILVKRNGSFSGTCSSNNPLIQNEDGACGICGARPQEKCKA